MTGLSELWFYTVTHEIKYDFFSTTCIYYFIQLKGNYPVSIKFGKSKNFQGYVFSKTKDIF